MPTYAGICLIGKSSLLELREKEKGNGAKCDRKTKAELSLPRCFGVRGGVENEIVYERGGSCAGF